MTDVIVRHSIRFEFDVDGHQIVAEGSAFSGEESVYVDGALVSRARSHQDRTAHAFAVAGTEYLVWFAVTNKIFGRVECGLCVKGEAIEVQFAEPRGTLITGFATAILVFFGLYNRDVLHFDVRWYAYLGMFFLILLVDIIYRATHFTISSGFKGPAVVPASCVKSHGGGHDG